MGQSRGKPLHKISCKDCGSSDGKQVFVQEDGTQNSYCFACETYDPMQDTTKIKYKEESTVMTMPDISNLKSLEIPDRLIRRYRRILWCQVSFKRSRRHYDNRTLLP